METNSCTWEECTLSEEDTSLYNPECFSWYDFKGKWKALVNGVTHPVIQTKFGVGDKCYFMQNNSIVESTISNVEIRIGVESNGLHPKGWYQIIITYRASMHNSVALYNYSTFKSKEELLKSL